MAAEAFVTCALDDSSAFGCLVVAHGVRKHCSTRTLVVLVSQHVTQTARKLLHDIFDDVVQVPPMDCSQWTVPIREELWQTFLKIHAWRLMQFKKCVFLDADTLVISNCDELFDREELSAAADVGWPDYFNSGVFVFSPSFATYDGLICLAQTGTSFDGTEQGLLNTYFNGWRSDIRFRLPFIYNMVANVSYSYAPAFQRFGTSAKIVHFVEHWKPWDVQWATNAASSKHQGPGGVFFPIWLDTFRNHVIPKLTEDCRHFLATRKFASVSSLASHIKYTASSGSRSSWHHESKGDQGPSTVDEYVEHHQTTQSNWQSPATAYWQHQLFEQRESEQAPSQSQSQIESWVQEDSGQRTHPPFELPPSTPPCPQQTWQEPQQYEQQEVPEYQKSLDDHHDQQEVVAQPLPAHPSSPATLAFSDPTTETYFEEEAKSEDEWTRMLAWEQGKIDYLGKDNFDNVFRHLQASMLGLEVEEVEEVHNASTSIPESSVSDVSKKADDLSGHFQELSVGEPEAGSSGISRPPEPEGYQVGDFSGMKEWEEGRFDMQGRDSSDNIMRRLEIFLRDSSTETHPQD